MNDIAKALAKKIRVTYLYLDKYENKRECPFFSEWKGMEQMLRTLGIVFEYDFSEDATRVTSVTVGDVTVEI